MNWEDFDSEVKNLANQDRLTPIKIGDILNLGESEFGERYSQVLSYFPEHKSGTISNWKSICKMVPPSVRPNGTRMSQMEAVRTLSTKEQADYLEWAVAGGCGREGIIARMVSEGLRPAPAVDAEKLIEGAIQKLNRALPAATPKMQEAIKLAVGTLQDASR
jgi:hypothetical protein